MPFDIATGTYTSADALQPLQETGSGITPVAEVTPVAVNPSPADQTPATDYVAIQSALMAAGEADARAAQASAQSAEDQRRQHYAQDILPVGAAYGDQMDLPEVPPAAVPPAMSDEYPFSGLEPTPAGAGFASTTEIPGP